MSRRERRPSKRGRGATSAVPVQRARSATPIADAPADGARSTQPTIGVLPAARRSLLAATWVLLLACVLLFSALDTLPGVHGDEGWVLLRAKQIAQGLRSLDGMNYYTGALFPSMSYLAAELFGYRVGVIRGLSALLNLGTLALVMLTVRRRHPESRAFLWTGLITASAVPFVLESRLATEITALSPLLVFAGLCLMQYAFSQGAGPRQRLFAAGSGLAFGLGVYNHMATAGIVAGLGIGYAVALGARALREPRSYAWAAGFALGAFPRLIQLTRTQEDEANVAPLTRVAQNLSSGFLSELAQTPAILRGMLDGDLLFQRFAGEQQVAVMPFFTLALLALVATALYQRPGKLARADRALLAAFAATIVIITTMAPWLALRYYEIPALCAPYVLVRLALYCAERPGWAGRLGTTVLPVVAAAQLFYVGVDYFQSQRASGGKLSVFPLGTRLTETSNHFVRTDALYAQLLAAGVQTIFADSLLGLSIVQYDLEAQRLRLVAHAGGPWLPEHGIAARVFYNGPTPIAGGLRMIDARGTEDIPLHGQHFKLDRSFDDHFLVFIYRPGTAKGTLSASQSEAR
jgi:4-amino-4-deoxy-L-arabinose transferase-like glycosyltransferase